MPKQRQVGQRFIQRLAEGVQRLRLVEPILAAQPHLVVVSAPSGYGKTVLAAQIAASGCYEDVAWIGGSGESGSVSDALAGVAMHLVGSVQAMSEKSLPELCFECNDALSTLPDDRSLLVVIDDASWARDPEALRVIEGAFAEAPVASTLLVTTRASARLGLAGGVWAVNAEQLMLTDAEIEQVWRQLACRPVSHSLVAEVAAASGRHAALVSLMARHAAFLDEDLTQVECTPSISALISKLVMGQLDESDCHLLDYAAVLGEADADILVAASHREDALEGLARIAAALPLVSVGSLRMHRRFRVHTMVAKSMASVQALVDRDPEGLWRIVDGLAGAGAPARALEVAIESRIPGLIASCLRSQGPHLLKGASWEVVRVALDALPAEAVAADPALLLARAEADWVAYRKVDAIRQAQLAIRIAELSNDDVVPASARASLAGMRMAVADYSGVISDLTPGPGFDQSLDADGLADMLYAVIPAYGFLGDCEGLTRSRSTACKLIDSAGAAGSRLARLQMSMGIVAEVFDGDPQSAFALFTAGASRVDVPQHWRALAISNSAASALELGDTNCARRLHDEAADLGSAFSTQMERALLRLLRASIEGLSGEAAGFQSAVEGVLSECEAQGELFTMATTSGAAIQVAVSLGQRDYARSLADRGLLYAAKTGSPVFVWMAELVHAQACLAIGDVERARSTAGRILPQVESIRAMGHVLHARMILAEAALSHGDLATATQNLSSVSTYIIEKSPALVVASYLRAFPDMLGPLALAMGVDEVPIRVLNLLNGQYGAAALAQASAVLTPAELARLSSRMRAEAERAASSAVPADTESVCTVRLFGGLEVVTPAGPVGDRAWTKRKARLLFAMLVSRLGTDVPRGEIIEYLWPEMEEERALNNFYVVWSAMKRALSPESVRETPCPFVEHAHGVCRLLPGRVISDLDRFNDALSRSRSAHAEGDAATELAALREVADLYRGEVLPGDVYDDWFAPLRERFRHEFEDAMLRAAQLLEARGEPHEGLSLLRRALQNDPWREDLYQAALRLQLGSGQRSAAIETYFSCRNRLVEDLGIDPSRETTALYEQVLGMEERPES